MQSIKQKHNRVWRRNTNQRKLLLELINGAKGHLDADELYRLAREKGSKISLSTVYRNLRIFKESGLVEERHFAEDHLHYEAKPRVEHHHLVCLNCGNVIEFTSPLTERMKSQVEDAEKFTITNLEVKGEGYCKKCSLKSDDIRNN